jgi:hypothetical protein
MTQLSASGTSSSRSTPPGHNGASVVLSVGSGSSVVPLLDELLPSLVAALALVAEVLAFDVLLELDGPLVLVVLGSSEVTPAVVAELAPPDSEPCEPEPRVVPVELPLSLVLPPASDSPPSVPPTSSSPNSGFGRVQPPTHASTATAVSRATPRASCRRPRSVTSSGRAPPAVDGAEKASIVAVPR